MGLMNQPLQTSTYPEMFPEFSMLGGSGKEQQQSRTQVFHVCDFALCCHVRSNQVFIWFLIYCNLLISQK